MMDDINSYTFDLKKEIENVWDILPKDSGLFLFIESKVVESEDEKSGKVFRQEVMGSQLAIKEFSEQACDYIKVSFKEDPALTSFHLPLSNDAYSGHLVSLMEADDVYTKIFGKEKKSLMQLFTLYHETAHGLIEGDFKECNNHPFRESTADAFTALSFFQRFGNSAGNILSMISWQRSINAVFGETKHLTTTVLDKIIVDSATRDFSKLSPEETVELARTYAEEWTPKLSVLSEAMPFFTQECGLNFLLGRETGLASASNFAFYIGSKFIQPFLNPEGVVFNGQTIRLEEDKRQEYARVIKERVSKMTFRDIFNPVAAKPEKFLTAQTSVKTKFMSVKAKFINSFSKTEPPLTEYLKVSLPAGQEHFTVKL